MHIPLSAFRWKKRTFAPPSIYSSPTDFVRPLRGAIVEVLVTWRERVLTIHHFDKTATVYAGPSSSGSDITIPGLPRGFRRMPLVTFDTENQTVRIIAQSNLQVCLLGLEEQNAEPSTHSLIASPPQIEVRQGEMARIDFSTAISVLVRHVPASAHAVRTRREEFSASESAAALLALALVSTLRFFTSLSQPPRLATPPDDAHYQAKIEFARPTPRPSPVQPLVETAVDNIIDKVVDKKVSVSEAPSRPTQTASRKLRHQRNTTQPSRTQLLTLLEQAGSRPSQNLGDFAKSAQGKAEGLGSDHRFPGLKEIGARGGTGHIFPNASDHFNTRGRAGGDGTYGVVGLGRRQQAHPVTAGGHGEVIAGAVDREAIRRVILENLKSVRSCFERELNRNPDLHGKLVLTWLIGEQGRVLKARVKFDDLGNAKVGECLLGHLRTWRFPEPPSRQAVEVESYPFLFAN